MLVVSLLKKFPALTVLPATIKFSAFSAVPIYLGAPSPVMLFTLKFNPGTMVENPGILILGVNVCDAIIATG